MLLKKWNVKNLFFALFIFVGSASYAQEGKSIEQQVKFSPFRILNYTAPGLEFSYEVGYGKQSTQLSAAYLVDLVHYIKVRSELKGVRLNLEQKYFVKITNDRTTRLYLSAKIGYNNMSFVAREQFWSQAENDEYSAKYNKKSQSFIVSVNSGVQGFVGNFVMDFSIGLSGIFKNVVDYNKPQDEELLYGMLNSVFEVAGRRTLPNIPISFKIGYRF